MLSRPLQLREAARLPKNFSTTLCKFFFLNSSILPGLEPNWRLDWRSLATSDPANAIPLLSLFVTTWSDLMSLNTFHGRPVSMTSLCLVSLCIISLSVLSTDLILVHLDLLSVERLRTEQMASLAKQLKDLSTRTVQKEEQEASQPILMGSSQLMLGYGGGY